MLLWIINEVLDFYDVIFDWFKIVCLHESYVNIYYLFIYSFIVFY